jgi:hypothetical protein
MTPNTKALPILDTHLASTRLRLGTPPAHVIFSDEVDSSGEPDEGAELTSRAPGLHRRICPIQADVHEHDSRMNLWGILVDAQSGSTIGSEPNYPYFAALTLLQDEGENTSTLPPIWGFDEWFLPFRAKQLPLLEYFEKLRADGAITDQVYETAVELWSKISSTITASLPEPDAAPGENGRLMIAFDDGVRHLEFEISTDGPIEAFELDRNTRETWDDEMFSRPVEISPTLIEKLTAYVE